MTCACGAMQHHSTDLYRLRCVHLGNSAGELLIAIAAWIAEQERIRAPNQRHEIEPRIGRPQLVFNRDHARQPAIRRLELREDRRTFEVNEAPIRRHSAAKGYVHISRNSAPV